MAAKSGIRTVAYNQICLTFLQKLCTADGGTVCDFDTDIRVGLMEFLKIINEKIPADRIASADCLLTGEILPRPEAGAQVLHAGAEVLLQELTILSWYCG